MPDKLVSICIPAYENPPLLKRTLDAILLQNYPAIEVIISDDSAGEDIKNALPHYAGKFPLKYFQNIPALGTPANWNYVLDKAMGDLVMLVHHDDWFNDPQAVTKYVNAFVEHPDVDFVFCRIMDFGSADSNQGIHHKMILDNLSIHPERLLLGNVIGPPSNVMIRRNVTERYTESFIWLVDVEFYIRLIKSGHKYFFIDEPLVLSGVHEQQVTAYVQRNQVINLKEHLLLVNKLDPQMFSDWRIYDLYWRLLRNNGIRSVDQLKSIGIDIGQLPKRLIAMLNFQKRIPSWILRNGILSKAMMFISFRS